MAVEKQRLLATLPCGIPLSSCMTFMGIILYWVVCTHRGADRYTDTSFGLLSEEHHRILYKIPLLLHFRHRLASGEARDVEVYSNPIPMDGQKFLYSVIYDITERK